MDLSIKDLILKTERPTNGLRAFAPQISSNGIGPNANAAFNDLLNGFRAERPDAPALPRNNSDDTRPVRSDSDNVSRRHKDDEKSSDSSDSSTPDNAQATPARDANKPASTETSVDESISNLADNSGPIDSDAAANTASTDKKPLGPDENLVPGPLPGATVPTATSKGETTVPAQDTQAALNGAPAKVTPKVSGKSETGSAANTGPGAETNIKPSLFRDLGAVASPHVTNDLGEEALTQLAGALNKPAANPANKSGTTGISNAETAAQNAAPRPLTSEPLPRLGEAFATVGLEGDAPDATPLRQPVTPGLLAIQEVGTNANGSSNGTNGTTSSTTPVGNPAQAMPANTTLPAQGAADGVMPLASMAAAHTEAEAPAPTFRAGGPALQNIIGGPLNNAGTPGNISSTNAAAQATRTPPSPPVALNDVAVHIARAASTGVDHINIKLKPAALGEVEVKLELTHDGRVAAVVTADRSDTLDMLARDAKSLERALADAGLKTDQGSLQFNLRGEGGNARGDGSNDGTMPNVAPKAADITAQDLKDGAIAGYANTRAAQGGVDIRV